MPEELTAAADLPRYVRWFAPWTWKPWTRWIIAPVLVVVYLISPPVVSYTVWRSGLVQHNWIVVPTVIALWPAYRLADECSAVDSLYNAEFELLTDLFGNPYPWNRAI